MSVTGRVRIGTRRSALALWQAGHVKAGLERAWPNLNVEIVKVVTTGDRIRDRPLASIGGKALFVKELEEQLLQGDLDLAVHSMKDVPAVIPDGLDLVATTRREDAADAFVARAPDLTPGLAALPEGALVGTGSLRRACQIKSWRGDIRIAQIRGNVDTRLRKLDEGRVDALLLAVAALNRLGLSHRVTERVPFERCLPAVGQGALAIEARANDDRIRDLVAPLNHYETAICVEAERGFLSRLDGGCRVPIAGYAELYEQGVRLRGLVGRPDGSRIVLHEKCGEVTEAWTTGVALAENLLAKGAGELIGEVLAHGDGS